MWKKLQKRIAAFKKIHAELQLQEAKQKEYEALVGESCSYPIIRELMNSCVNGVTISFVFKDGTKMDMKKDEAVQEDMYKHSLF